MTNAETKAVIKLYDLSRKYNRFTPLGEICSDVYYQIGDSDAELDASCDEDVLDALDNLVQDIMVITGHDDR